MRRGPRQIGTFRKKHGKRLSLCMIVKNEIETIERCLSNARPYVDQIVVVDTGSTDGTREVARRFADVFDEIEWPGSFSEARNHSFELATGDYLMYLDGDEYIEGADDWKRLHAAIAKDDVACVLLPIRNVLGEGNIVAADRMWQERVFVNHASMRFVGRVHNQIQRAVLEFVQATGAHILRAEAEVVHTGYAHSTERMRQKYAPRVELLQHEYLNPRSDVFRAYYGYQLGIVYFVLEQYGDALDVFNEIDYAKLNPVNAFYTRLVAAQSAIKLDKGPMALLHCNQMLALDRSEPIAYYTTGVALILSGKPADGVLMLLEAYNVHEASGGAVRFVLNPRTLFTMLARVCARLGLEDHRKVFEALAAKEDPPAGLARRLIRSLMAGIATAEQKEKAA